MGGHELEALAEGDLARRVRDVEPPVLVPGERKRDALKAPRLGGEPTVGGQSLDPAVDDRRSRATADDGRHDREGILEVPVDRGAVAPADPVVLEVHEQEAPRLY